MNIEAHKAVITTATVEIRTLTVSGRQVTLAVFRQLQKEPWDDPDGLLRGTPWGSVNYHPDPRCKTTRDHLHVVWQFGDELRRAFVEPAGRLDLWAETAAPWLTVAIHSGWRPKEWTYDKKSLRVLFKAGALDVETSVATRCLLNAEREGAETAKWAQTYAGTDTEWVKERIEQAGMSVDNARRLLEEAVQPLLGEMALEEWAQAVNDEIVADQERHQRRLDNWKLANELPQLFIAV